jgi:DNA-binding transcriptional MerR regulator
VSATTRATAREPAVGATTERPLRIGEVAELSGTTPRTIRYYEEIGLLPGADNRVQGQHRCYRQQDVERIRETVRLRDLLGLSLEQLSKLLQAEAARAELRQEFQQTDDPETQRRILESAMVHIDTQLALVRDRRRELQQLEHELAEKRRSVQRRVRELKR